MSGSGSTKPVFLASLPSLVLCFQPRFLLFDCSSVLEYAKIRTVLQSIKKATKYYVFGFSVYTAQCIRMTQRYKRN